MQNLQTHSLNKGGSLHCIEEVCTFSSVTTCECPH
ncbi:hypothetical protein V6Z11_A06G134300 [Gossypium hirsutum]